MLIERWRITRARHPFYAAAFTPSGRALVGGCEWYGGGVLLALDAHGAVTWEAWQPRRPDDVDRSGVTCIAVDPSGELALCARMGASRRVAFPAMYRIDSAEGPAPLGREPPRVEWPVSVGHASGAALVDGALWVRRIASHAPLVLERVELPAGVRTFAATDPFTHRRMVARDGRIVTAMRKRHMAPESGSAFVRDSATGQLVPERYPEDGALLLCDDGDVDTPTLAPLAAGEASAMIANGERIFVGTDAGRVSVVDWDGDSAADARDLFVAHAAPIEAMCFLGDEQTLVTGSRDDEIAMWDDAALRQREVARLRVGFSVRGLAADPGSGRLLVVGKVMRESTGVAAMFDVVT